MDSAFKTGAYPAYTTAQIKEWLALNSVGKIPLSPQQKTAMTAEVERRAKVEAGDWSVMTASERLRASRAKEAGK